MALIEAAVAEEFFPGTRVLNLQHIHAQLPDAKDVVKGRIVADERNTPGMSQKLKLPKHLASRVRVVQSSDRKPRYVLYWLCTANRTDENPALDTARLLAGEYQVPLLVYQGLSEDYRYASDRHHTFLLQGAKDLQSQFQRLQISYAFHLATDQDRRPHLVELAEQAGLVVTEDMPVEPARRFLRTLARHTNAGILAVDTACVVPMQQVGKAYTRAYKFRSATRDAYAEATSRSWPEVSTESRHFEGQLSFEPLSFAETEIAEREIAELVARCSIDHTVGPVVDTPGGSQAGYARWDKFRATGLRAYAKKRNNALEDGVSRMSAYLHFGMVSPMRIAREAAEADHEGAEKYLDELQIWRELAYAFCFYRSDHDRWSALPEWARETLQEHRSDPRGRVYTWEQLARGQTDDDLWNAAQQSLLMQGELHNNMRMTWGKAILNWTDTPQQALRTIINLNHRYALDGRDPASYGGILWCLGQFDRPFEPEKPIFGTVRPRPTEQHALRLSPTAYLARVTKPRFALPSIAVIGAGLSGAIAARTLADHGLRVRVFEKSKGCGGRMATRRSTVETQPVQFDHGAQYFTARDRRFRSYVQAWAQSGVVARWPQESEADQRQRIVVLESGGIQSESMSQQRYVAVPGMNALVKNLLNSQVTVALQERLVVNFGSRVAKIERAERGHRLLNEDQQCLGEFDYVLVATPAAQASELLASYPDMVQQTSAVSMTPCWTAMVSLTKPVTEDWVGAFVHDSFLTWVARNSTKPGRDSSFENLVLHAGPEWTEKVWNEVPAQVASQMLEEFWRCSGCEVQSPEHLEGHRWRYALAPQPLTEQCIYDSSGIGVCGDWLAGSRVEGAFLSGVALAGRILGTLKPRADASTASPPSLF